MHHSPSLGVVPHCRAVVVGSSSSALRSFKSTQTGPATVQNADEVWSGCPQIMPPMWTEFGMRKRRARCALPKWIECLLECRAALAYLNLAFE